MVVGTFLALAAVVVAAPAAASSHSEFVAVADTYVESSKPTNNYGSSSTVRTDASPQRIAYLKFDVQGEGVVSSAVLRLWVQSSNNVGFQVHIVADSSWGESTTNFNNAPALGPVIANSGPVAAGTFVDVDVSAAVTGDGLVTLALTSTSNTSTRYTSREGANPPVLFVPGPPSSSPFVVTRVSSTTYQAVSQTTGQTYTGTLKFVVESATNELSQIGGGLVTFTAGTFDLGSDHFEFYDVVGVEFEGQGIDVTTIRNSTSEATDTEPFDFSYSVRLAVRDMTLFAGGSPRSTSDVLDFDGGNDVVVERVKITGSRGRGIVFDGKELTGAGTANRNVVRDCQISNIPGDGIELLASSENLIENCTIVDVGGHGIQINKASPTADQPNKQSTDNILVSNTITNAGQDGIDVNSGDRNQIVDNVITNSSDDTTGRDGIRLSSFDGVRCDDNVIAGNIATDNQGVKTQRWGLNIQSSNCHRTVIGEGNDFAGNLAGEISDGGTNTQYPDDSEAPTAPTNLAAPTVAFNRVVLTWDAASDNVGVTGYTVFRDGVEVGSTGASALSFTDTTVAANATYVYAVTAEDAAGNQSSPSNPVTVNTPTAPSTFVLDPLGDAYVDSSTAGSNFGSSSQLRTDASPQIVSYLQFQVGSLPSPVTSARLRIYAKSNLSAGFEVRSVGDNGWNESTITFSSAPAVGSVIATSGPVSANTWIEIDVSGYVTGQGTYSLALTPLSSTNLRLASRETTTPPELVVDI